MCGFNHVISFIKINWLAKRNSWEDKKYIYGERDNIYMHMPDGSVNEWHATVVDLLAEDWEVFK